MRHSKTSGNRRIYAATSALVLVIGLIAAASAYAKMASSAAGGTVHVIEHAITDTEIPTGGGMDVDGNILVFDNPVFNASDKKRVGHDEGFCNRIDVSKGIWECLWTTFLKGGQITVQGPFYDTRNSVLSITGGTGSYRRARGQMKLVSRNRGKKYDFIFQMS